MIQDISISISPEAAFDKDSILKYLNSHIKDMSERINDIKIIRKSIDARKKDIKVNLLLKIASGEDEVVPVQTETKVFHKLNEKAPELIIVGSGPAGLFAGLKALELGIRPIILERGKPVDERIVDIAGISLKGELNSESNYCFGEGGAGTFSDGKLFTRSKKRGDNREILQLLHQFGADEDVLYNSHPHIGSDKLPKIIKNIRNCIIENGGEIKFNTRVVDILIDNNEIRGVRTSDGEIIKGPVLLATGHSAKDIYHILDKRDVKLESKGFAIGMRLEHPQQLIDILQYHKKEGRGKYLPPAEYRFVSQINGRGVYSFCMCPGGVVVPSMSDKGYFVVNGMSGSKRSGKWANAAIVVEIRPEDISGFDDGLKMLDFQEKLEIAVNKSSPDGIKAPAQRMKDFVEGKNSDNLPKSSYPPGLVSARLDKIFPDFITEGVKEGVKKFNERCPGFLTNEALFIGLESRTSSPVRIPRDQDTLEHPDIVNLYPAGEGAGYAGGIVSSAIDGQRCVQAFYNKLINRKNAHNT